MIVRIGRNSGPCTDIEVESNFEPSEIPLILDVLGIVNQVSKNKERWYLQKEDESEITIPYGC